MDLKVVNTPTHCHFNGENDEPLNLGIPNFQTNTDMAF